MITGLGDFGHLIGLSDFSLGSALGDFRISGLIWLWLSGILEGKRS